MKLQEMLGLSVFDVEDGKEIGKVLDFMISEDWKILGVILEGKSIFSPHYKAVLWEDISAYGEDAVMIRNQQAVRKMEAENIQTTFALGDGKVKELSVLTSDGVMIGHVSDVYFDHELGNTITGLEISDGFISDLVEGRRWLPFTPEITKGENAIMVPPLSEERLEKTINSANG
ncbi:photosystem reaction center subunit H [Paenibacillus sp. CAA11]|uniref:PRC-barrel domain-containing protein n=1 Tax=Paenibacillus sp. CAA11 TaxID=1532905 RepID=UPI000D3C429C|nr:PRC-barrel domain-containing protein [Paenibacillus sp. CAA11]AWB45673.1 photosystem reaction center subunit H [Paenibacillus sp. CAA11]